MTAHTVAMKLMRSTSVTPIIDPNTPMRQPVNLSLGPKISLTRCRWLYAIVRKAEIQRSTPAGSCNALRLVDAGIFCLLLSELE